LIRKKQNQKIIVLDIDSKWWYSDIVYSSASYNFFYVKNKVTTECNIQKEVCTSIKIILFIYLYYIIILYYDYYFNNCYIY